MADGIVTLTDATFDEGVGGAGQRPGAQLAHDAAVLFYQFAVANHRSLLGAGVADNTAEQLSRWVRNARDLKPGVLMPPYNTLSEADLQDLVQYLQGLR